MGKPVLGDAEAASRSMRARFAALAATACLLGGPRRFVGRSFVQSTPSSRQGRQGTFWSSHLTLRMLHISQARLKRVSLGLMAGSRAIMAAADDETSSARVKWAVVT